MRVHLAFFILCCSAGLAQGQVEDRILRTLGALASQADSQQNQGNYSESESSRRQLISLMEQTNFSPVEIARQLSNLASVLNLSGNPEEAQMSCERAQSILEKNPTDDLVQEAVLLGNLAEALRLQGNLEGARVRFEEELSLLSSSGLGDTHFAASAMVGIGAVEAELGNLQEAKALYEVALPIFLKISDESHPTTARIVQEYETIQNRIKK
jgi:eukaryotic-like serine/threonine-protein kinase